MEKREEQHFENSELEKYALSVVIQKLDSNPDIRAVFGANYAREVLPKHVSKIMFNHKKDINAGGDFNITNGVIRVFHKDSIPDVYTKEDLANNPKVLSVLIHEMIHAMLWMPDEKPISGSEKRPTGLMRFYDKTGDSFNKALNEGFTEWVRTLVDQGEQESYLNQRNAIEMMAIKHGNQKVLALAKDHPINTIGKLYNFKSQDETIRYIQDSDRLLYYHDEVESIKIIENRLEQRLKEAEESNKEFDAKAFAKEQALNRDLIAEYRRSKGWINHEDIDTDELKSFLQHQREYSEKLRDEYLTKFEVTNFNRLFGNMARNIEQSTTVSPYDLKKLVQCYKLIQNSGLRKSVEKLITSKLIDTQKDLEGELFDEVLKNPDILDKISNYEYVVIQGKDNINKCLIPKDGKGPVYNLGHGKTTIDATGMRSIAKEDGSTQISFGDFTEKLGFDGNYTKAISQYEQIRNEYLAKDPNARIMISNRAIILQSNVIDNEYYILEEGYITKDEYAKPIDSRFENVVNKLPTRESIFTRMKRNVSKLFGKEELQEPYYEYYKEDEHEKYVAGLRKDLFANGEKSDDTIENLKQNQKAKENSEIER